ncbi:MAG: hypothetical protein ACTSX7_08820 [Alphaproteobacteria bacterium]
MGENIGVIDFPALRNEFGIDENSDDGKMLETVSAGLKFVNIIHPDDSIPCELLDGSASWSVESEHRATAKNRLIVQLVTSLSGSEEIVRDPKQLVLMAENPETLGQLKSGFKAMADRVGAKGDGEKEIIARMERLAHELSYIEALWAYFLRIKDIGKKVDQACRLYSSDSGIKDTLERVPLLLKPVVEELEFHFDQLEAQSEIAKALENCDAHIEVIREARDTLHVATQVWSDLAANWQEEPALKRSDKLERLAQETYQFLAQHFPQTQEWKLTY